MSSSGFDRRHGTPQERRAHFVELIRRVSPGADPESVLLFGQIMRANHKLTAAVDRHLGPSSLTWAKFRLLMDLGRGEHISDDGMQPSELSAMEGLSRNTISALIASLEESGMVSRELHATDRRRFVIRLTPEGRRVLRGRMEDHFQFVTRCMGVLDPGERSSLLGLLSKLTATMPDRHCGSPGEGEAPEIE